MSDSADSDRGQRHGKRSFSQPNYGPAKDGVATLFLVQVKQRKNEKNVCDKMLNLLNLLAKVDRIVKTKNSFI